MTYRRHSTKSRLRLGIKFLLFLAGLVGMARLWEAGVERRWRGPAEFSVVEQRGDDELIVRTVLPEYARGIDWVLPARAVVPAAFGYGPYQWRKVYELGRLDGRGGLTLARTTQSVLGLAVKGWQVGDDSNLTVFDRLKWWYWQTFRVRQKLTISLAEDLEWRQTLLVNEQVFSQADAVEGLSLTLINGGSLDRVLTNHGLELVSVTSSSEESAEGRSRLLLKNPDQENSRTVAWLKQLLPLTVIAAPESDYLNDLVLIVAKDYN